MYRTAQCTTATMRNMNYVFLLFVVFIATLIGLSVGDVGHTRDKRSVLRLGEMISCTTEKNMMQVLQEFNGYGCWCGLGGRGPPVDDLDRCCQIHDQCYTSAINEHLCASSEVYTVDYHKGCKSKHASCSSKPGSCAMAVCECDKAVATCMAKNQRHYSKKFRNYERKTKCL